MQFLSALVGVSGAGKGVGELIVDRIGQTRGTSGELSRTWSLLEKLKISLKVTLCAACCNCEPFVTTLSSSIGVSLEFFWILLK